MKNLRKQLLAFILGGLICLFWLYRGYRVGKKNNDDNFKNPYAGKVVRAYIPETAKFLNVVFADSSEKTLDFWGLCDLVEVGDSLKKEANSFRFIVYKEGNTNDSIVYEGTNFYTK
ncbi:hypothetical protein [Phnomibacter sp. MR]|uniref:hypothetical protein n=1 Tax=Phnomibacter sp. MR TaxID=3042318 RepID=UPI003A805339